MVTSVYTCLSYCWGGDQPVKTTKATESAHHAAIPFESLPQTLKDALIVSARLDVQYLWIDTLCIIQDSSEDMVRELESMPSIYRCTYFTIAASSASTCHSGFLSPRTWSPNTSSLRLSYRPGDQEDHAQPLDLIQYDSSFYSQDPAETRGWVVQELLLSPRVLDFKSLLIIFRCAGSFASDSDSDYFDSEPGLMFDPIRAGLAVTGHGMKNTSSAKEQWAQVVQEYTKRKLSLPSDKLIAIAAVAQYYHDMRPSRYFAGLWEADLLQNLVWTSGSSHTLLPRPSTYRAPSWSWAAVDAPVDTFLWGDRDQLPTAEIIQCGVELKHKQLPSEKSSPPNW